jgi:NIMA (never in mitosis gene a)-related kinase
LKEIEMGDDDNAVTASGRSYDHEMQIMRAIPPHPHIVRLIDSFCLGSKYYIVIEYCDRGDLSDYLRRISAPSLVLEIPEPKIWKFIIQTLLALDHIHDKQIVHSDLKPSNIFLSGKDMNVKLADFGTSQQLTKNYHFVHECMGTLFYISPEVCKGEPFNTKTDIWALGCILYEMCTNRKPFDGLSDDNLKTKIISY